MQEEFFNVWNVSDKIDKGYKLLHLTNNGLQRYNKHFNTICTNRHPNLVAYIHALCKEADRVVQRMNDVSKGREIPAQYNEPVFPQIPADFYSDDKKPKAKNKAAGKSRRAKKDAQLMCCYGLVWVVLVGSMSLCSSVSALF